MRAHLARHVCRRMLGRDALILTHSRRPRSQCLLLSCIYVAPSSLTPNSVLSQAQQRTFFEFLRKPRRSVKIPRFDPGWAELLTFRHHQINGLRMPSNEEILKGFRTFVGYKLAKGLPINSMHAFCSQNALVYLVDQEAKQGLRLLDVSDLVEAQKAFAHSPLRDVEHHLQMTELLHSLLIERFKENVEGNTEERMLSGNRPTADEIYAEMGRYVLCMAQYNGATKAAATLAEYSQSAGIMPGKNQRLWDSVLGGLAHEGREDELLKYVETAEELHFNYTATVQHIMVAFYAAKNDRMNIQKWLDRPVHGRKKQMREATLVEIMRFVGRSNDEADKEWGEEVLRKVCDSDPCYSLRHAILQWAVFLKGKSTEDMVEMIKVMQGVGHKVTEKTIRILIQAAVDKGDPYLAERLFSLFDRFGLVPDPQTFALQIQYRVKAGDLTGAEAAYEALLGDLDLETMDSPEDDFSDGGEAGETAKSYYHPFGLGPPNPYLWALPTFNQYIRALCETHTEENTQQAIRVAQSVEDRGLPLEPVTLVTMCMNFFARDRSFDVIDALSVYAGQYSTRERTTLCRAFVDYICNREHSTARAWDAYTLLRQFFPELDKESRVKVMHEFFGRRRGDMASHVFGHMRQKEGVVRPSSEEYIQVLEGLSRWPDEPALTLIYNMLKLDPLISYNTRLYNALMLAWGATERPTKAEIFWEHIQNSIEGPNYNSLDIVFWVFGRIPWGEEKAQRLWQRLQHMEVDTPEQVWRSYVAGLAAQGEADKVIKLCQEGCEGVERLQDETLGIIYNALPNQELRNRFEAWAIDVVPEQWRGLKKKWKPKTLAGQTAFPTIKRVFKA